MEKILKTYPSGKKEWLYRDVCIDCAKDRGFVKLYRLKQRCRECAGLIVGLANKGKVGPNKNRKFSEDVKQKMSAAKIGKVPWNKGLKGVSAETSQKMSLAKTNHMPYNKGKKMALHQKIKLSCANRQLSLTEFNGFSSADSKKERDKFYNMQLNIQCFERDNYSCDVCLKHGGSLNAHHLNSFSHFPDQRFDLNNLITLCYVCHKAFHTLHGNGKRTPNTKEQYIEFKSSINIYK